MLGFSRAGRRRPSLLTRAAPARSPAPGGTVPEIRTRLRPLLLLLVAVCGRADLRGWTGGGQQRRPDRPDHQADDAAGEGRAAVRHLRLRADRRHDRPGRRRAQRAGARRRERQGADREVPPRRRHLLRLVEQRGEPASRSPACPTACSGSRPRSRARHPAADRHRPGAGRRHPGRAAGHPAPRQHGAGRGAQRRPTRTTRRRISGQELRAIGINQDFAPDADVNVNAQNPVIGVRSFGSDPSLVSDLVSAQRRRLPERQRGRHREALPRSRRHGDRQPLRRADHQPHPRGVGAHRRPAVPGRDQRAASTRS